MKLLPTTILCLILSATAFARTEITVKVGNTDRFAFVHEGEAKNKKSPVVFVFHGHGGSALIAERRLNFHDSWKEAMVVYMHGMPGVIGITDALGEKNGWQLNPGDLEDRDIKFFDEMLKRLIKDYKIDESRIYAVGHSNGGRFVNVLWKMRAEKFAALCSVAGPGGLMVRDAVPRPLWLSMGRSDRIVPFENQERSAEFVKSMFKVDSAKAKTDGDLTTFKSPDGVELVIEIRDAGHQFPTESIPKMTEFFKRNKLENR